MGLFFLEGSCQKTKRKRKVIYFNPPYSLGVSTRIGAIFLKIFDKCFAKPNPLYKIFNRDTVKVSYRTTPNMKQIVTGHNTHILSRNKQEQEQTDKKTCSCPKAKKNKAKAISAELLELNLKNKLE